LFCAEKHPTSWQLYVQPTTIVVKGEQVLAEAIISKNKKRLTYRVLAFSYTELDIKNDKGKHIVKIRCSNAESIVKMIQFAAIGYNLFKVVRSMLKHIKILV
jgi:hypothetical protein